MRTLVISDIHGCIDPLEKLLAVLTPDPAKDRLILLGDLFDRGPDSWEVLQRVKGLQTDFGSRFILLRGNHEDYLMQPRLSFSERRMWERVGRAATVRSFKMHGEKMEDCRPWLQQYCRTWYTDNAFLCVHAGLKIFPPEANDSYTMVHDHGIVLQNLYAGPLAITGHIALETPVWFAGDGKTVSILEEDVWLPLPERGTICIDAGCGKGGRLIGMEIDPEAGRGSIGNADLKTKGGWFRLHGMPE